MPDFDEEPTSEDEQEAYARRDEELGPVKESQVCMRHGVVFESRQKLGTVTTWNEMVLDHDGCTAVAVRETVYLGAKQPDA